jgi:fused signal recognition particle receptor
MFGFFKKLFSPLSKKIRSLFSRTPDDTAFDHLEQIFYEADLGAATSAHLVEKVRALYRKNPQITAEEILSHIKEELLQALHTPPQKPLHSPHVILFVGVNGSGKTTTLAKLAARYASQGKKVLVVAGDTFRAAAAEQLDIWAKKLHFDIVKSQANSDPSGVVFDALAAAKSRHIDLVLIDTAGRLQTKTDLMQELAKIRRICDKQIPGAPHDTYLTLDATIGQNALDQVETFHKFTPLTGLILTKLDGTAKGGIAYTLQTRYKIPILYIGTGEKAEDLEEFNPREYVEGLIG